MAPVSLFLIVCLCPYMCLARNQGYSSKPSPRNYYYKKMTPTPASREYYYKPSKSKTSTYLQNLMYKKVTALTRWMDKATSKYFKLVPHSGKYPGEENPLSGDPYPWSKKTSSHSNKEKQAQKAPRKTYYNRKPSKSNSKLTSIVMASKGYIEYYHMLRTFYLFLT